MKIKTAPLSYEQVIALPPEAHRKPLRPSRPVRWLLKTLSAPELKKVNFQCRYHGMERLSEDEPCLILMNHSSFIDLKIASTVLYPRPINIVCTSDGFVGKSSLMRRIGCIPTAKFCSDGALVRDMLYTVRTLKSSILLYPEASYSFDGTATPLPDTVGKCIKMLRVPVVMIRTCGAFSRDPLYNGLRLRRVDVSAELRYLLSPQEAEQMSVGEINAVLREQFSFDHFRWQQEHHIRIDESFRAEGLNRVLYKCPSCMAEGQMESHGASLRCGACGKSYTLDEYGFMAADEGETELPHIPDWYRWEREEVRKELENGSYLLDIPVNICMLVDTKAIYRVGDGRLRHDREGFRLTGCEGKLDYHQKPQSSYSLYSDYFWYELGDMICIGDKKVLYYCFPKEKGDVVAKTRLAAEELYDLSKE